MKTPIPQRNRRVVPLPSPKKPIVRNPRDIELRRDAMNDLVGSLVMTGFTLACALGACYGTFVVNARDASLSLEVVIIGASVAALVVSLLFVRRARVAWREIDRFDEKSNLRNKLLASIARPVDEKLQLPFTNRLE